MTRQTWIVAGLMLGAIGLSVVFGFRSLGEQRAELLEHFSRERLHQLAELVYGIESDLDRVGENLSLAARLARASDSDSDRMRELGVIARISREYRVVEVRNEHGDKSLRVAVVKEAEESADRFEEDLALAARQVVRRPIGSVYTSHALANDKTGWLRIFAVSLPPSPLRESAAIVFLVDLQPLFTKLSILTADAGLRAIVLGSHGGALPVTDPTLAQMIRSGRPVPEPLEGLIRQMRSGERGSAHLDGKVTQQLGFGDADIVATFDRIEAPGASPWSIAVLASASTIAQHERALVIRLATVFGAIMLVVLAFASYVVVTTWHSRMLRERLDHAESLAHLHEKSEKIIDNIPTGVAALSADGRVTAVNRILRETRPPTLPGSSLREVLPAAPEAVIEQLRNLVQSARRGGAPESLHARSLQLFNHEGHYNVHAIPLRQPLRDASMLLVIQDVSEVHALQSQLLHAEKLATVGGLAAGIAHEIGTPLGIVRGRAEYMIGKLDANDQKRDGLTVIIEQIDRVSRTVQQLLDFARVKPAVMEPVDIEATIKKAVDLMRFEAVRRHVTLTGDVEPGAGLVAADPDQLQQILVNLVMNALDASPQGGQVTIGAARVDDEWPAIRIWVADTGHGIPSDIRERIFDPFFTTKKRGQGTGLGLAVVSQIARSHEADITVQSTVGRGTVIALLWPRADRRRMRADGKASAARVA